MQGNVWGNCPGAVSGEKCPGECPDLGSMQGNVWWNCPGAVSGRRMSRGRMSGNGKHAGNWGNFPEDNVWGNGSETPCIFFVIAIISEYDPHT